MTAAFEELTAALGEQVFGVDLSEALAPALDARGEGGLVDRARAIDVRREDLLGRVQRQGGGAMDHHVAARDGPVHGVHYRAVAALHLLEGHRLAAGPAALLEGGPAAGVIAVAALEDCTMPVTSRGTPFCFTSPCSSRSAVAFFSSAR